MDPTLLMLADGRFPAGGHTNSAGVEAAVALGDASDGPSLESYLFGRLATTGQVDAAFAAHVVGLADRTGRAESVGLEEAIENVDREYDARILSPHLRGVSRTFGRQLLRAGRPIWSSELVEVVGALPGGPQQPVALGALVAAGGGSPSDAAAISFHHLASAVTTAAVRMLGLDPVSTAVIQAHGLAFAERYITRADTWAATAPGELPADGGSLTEILGDDHARWDARLFVA